MVDARFCTDKTMNKKIILTAFFLLFPAFLHAQASSDQIKLVKYFLKTPTKNLNPDLVPDFLAVGEKNVPSKLRQGYVSKVMELYALRNVAEGNKQGFVRTPDDSAPSCREFHVKKGIRMYSSVFSKHLMKGHSFPEIVRLMRLGHFSRLSSDYMPCLRQKTKCSQQDMVCNFTLSVVSVKKGKNRRYYYFIYGNDPLAVVYSLCTHPGLGKNTNFFSEKPSVLCSH